MSTVPLEQEIILGPESAGLLMTPEEFDAIEEYDEEYRYELVKGVLVVTPIPPGEETGPNELLGHRLLTYQEMHPQGSVLDHTLPQQYVRVRRGCRIADRLIWTGLGRMPNLRRDVATIAVEFVSGSRRDRQRDYVDKRKDYQKAGIAEYWIVDRFQRTLTVIRYLPTGVQEHVIRENETYQSPHLPGFEVPLAALLAAADRAVQAKRTRRG
jgi:Uma2 family endonuclease